MVIIPQWLHFSRRFHSGWCPLFANAVPEQRPKGKVNAFSSDQTENHYAHRHDRLFAKTDETKGKHLQATHASSQRQWKKRQEFPRSAHSPPIFRVSRSPFFFCGSVLTCRLDRSEKSSQCRGVRRHPLGAIGQRNNIIIPSVRQPVSPLLVVAAPLPLKFLPLPEGGRWWPSNKDESTEAITGRPLCSVDTRKWRRT